MTHLLDGNVLIALVVASHVHHRIARRWLDEQGSMARFATCPITEGALLRLLLREGIDASPAWGALAAVSTDDRHEFWGDDVGYGGVPTRGVVGHRQVTDAYLAQIARHHDGRLATLDCGLAAMHADVAVLLPTGRSKGPAPSSESERPRASRVVAVGNRATDRTSLAPAASRSPSPSSRDR